MLYLIRSGYATSPVHSVLDMTVANNFIEDYDGNIYENDDSTEEPGGGGDKGALPMPAPASRGPDGTLTSQWSTNTSNQKKTAKKMRAVHPMGYSRQEVAMGWRLPPPVCGWSGMTRITYGLV